MMTSEETWKGYGRSWSFPASNIMQYLPGRLRKTAKIFQYSLFRNSHRAPTESRPHYFFPTHIFGHFPPTREYVAVQSDTAYTCMINEPSGSPIYGQIKYGQCTNHTPYPLRHVSHFDNFTTDLPAH